MIKADKEHLKRLDKLRIALNRLANFTSFKNPETEIKNIIKVYDKCAQETAIDSEEDAVSASVCCYCKDFVTIPTAVAGCTFCYYCIKSNPNLETDIVNGRNSCGVHAA